MSQKQINKVLCPNFKAVASFHPSFVAWKWKCARFLDCFLLKLLIAWFWGFKGQATATHSWPVDFCSLEVTLILDRFSKKGLDYLIQFWSQTLQHGTYRWLPLAYLPDPPSLFGGGLGSRLDSKLSPRTPTLSCHEKPKNCSTAHSNTLHDNHWVLDPNWP